MIAEGFNILVLSAIALILVFLAGTIAKRQYGVSFKSFLAACRLKNNAADRMFESHRIPALKKCPSCTGQLPLSALMCDACDYNFLSGMVGRGHKMLPSPKPLVHEVSKQSLASAGV
jgi:hypothetical protein